MPKSQDYLPPAANDVVFMGAVAALFRGDAQTGLANIASLANEGYERAALSYAQLLAYQGQWQEVGEHAGQFLLNPNPVCWHDLYLDAWRLLALSAMHTGDWKNALEVATIVKDASGTASRSKKHTRLKTVNAFQKYFVYGGKGELPFAVFAATTPDTEESSHLYNSLEQHYHDCAKITRSRSHTDLYEAAIRQDLYTAAMDYNLPHKTAELFKKSKAPPDGYNQLLFLAKALSLAEEKKDARQMLEQAISIYVPCDIVDVLPVSAHWDPILRHLIPTIKTDNILARERKTKLEWLHKVPSSKSALAATRNKHLLLMAEQASFIDIHRWEEQLAGDPANLDLRKLLIICYQDRISHYTECVHLHAKHVFWVIEHAPQTVFAGDDYCMLIHKDQKLYYEKGKTLWLKVLRKAGTTTQMVRNAAHYLRYDTDG